jgi:K(+)-stimulated pyrophosphate-energized sodium pump
VALVVGKIVEWHTSDHHKTVKEVARHSQSGAAMVITSGLAEGMRSAALCVVTVAVGMFAAFVAGSWSGIAEYGGIYGVTVAAIGAVAAAASMVSLEAFGPIADNAAGLARTAPAGSGAERSAAALESAGSGTRATARGFMFASAILTALALLGAFTEAGGFWQLSLVRPETTGPLLLGAAFPLVVASLIIAAVGRVAGRVFDEVRRLAESSPRAAESPDDRRCVTIGTSAALRQMALPGLLALALPLAMGQIDLGSLAGFLLGLFATGSPLALFMISSGGAWESARRFIETGAFGGLDSGGHEATVVGDAVGDSFKDAAGPAIATAVVAAMIVALTFLEAFI